MRKGDQKTNSVENDKEENMSEGLNRAILLGNLGADPELRHTQNGTAVLNIRLATTESYLDRNRERKERVEWHNVVVWEKRAEGLARILQKGDKILVEGSIQSREYEARDGGKRTSTDITARNIVLCGGGPGGQRQQRQPDQQRREEPKHERDTGYDPNSYQEDGPSSDIPF